MVLHDLAPGNTLRTLGRDIHIFDVDAFTREYFRRELKFALPPVVQGPDTIRPDQRCCRKIGVEVSFNVLIIFSCLFLHPHPNTSAQQATGLGFHNGDRTIKSSHGVRSTDYLQRKEDLEKTRR